MDASDDNDLPDENVLLTMIIVKLHKRAGKKNFQKNHLVLEEIFRFASSKRS
jgi:hypothetical protein